MFLKKIASRFMGREGPSRRAVAAFGKHPGWNDHIDDLGLETDLLVTIKRLLYVEGIAGNIDAGAWEKLGDDQRLEGFDHALLVRGGEELAIGRLWSSRDGKGRTKYPMVVCADCSGMGAAAALARALPMLESVKRDCEGATTREPVLASLDRARAALSAWNASEAPPPPAEDPMKRLASCAAMGDQGLVRVLYQLERELQAYRRGGKLKSMVLSPQHLRVPACGSTPEQAIGLWNAFLGTQLDDSAPLMLLHPLGRGWVDVIVGAPTPAQFFCIRATDKGVPMTTDIPYNIDVEFVSRARQLIGT